jgi:hypothetical protein
MPYDGFDDRIRALAVVTSEWREVSELARLAGTSYTAMYQRVYFLRKWGLVESRPSARHIKGKEWRLRQWGDVRKCWRF